MRCLSLLINSLVDPELRVGERTRASKTERMWLDVFCLGLLIAKKKLFTNCVPVNAGGGTVVSVTRTYTEYTKDIETREESGTPNILGSIKAGLVFELKEAVGHHEIQAREIQLTEKFFQRFRENRTLFVLGPTNVSRLPIFSFRIFVPSLDKYLHHNFVCSLFNDLFGIQVRSGCSCAGPYSLVNDKSSYLEKKVLSSL